MLNKEFPKPHPAIMAERAKGIFIFGPFRLDAGERALTRDDEPVALTPKAFDTLLVLVAHGGRLVEKDKLLEEVWQDTFVEEKTLAQNVLTIRKALGKTPEGAHYIETVPKHGYRFAAPVSVVAGSASEFVAETRSRTEVVVEEEFEIAERSDADDEERTRAATEVNASARAIDDSDATSPRSSARAHLAEPATESARLTKRSLSVATIVVVVACLLLAVFAFRSRVGGRGSDQLFREFEITKLTSAGDVWGSIAISPDGKYAAYASLSGARARLLVRQIGAGGSVEVVPPAEAFYVGVTFSNDGSSLYYVTKAKDSIVGILYRVPVLGGVPKKLIEDVDSPVALSPDGSRLAFVRVNPNRDESALVVADSSGANERQLAVRPRRDGFSLGGLSWSPDGRLIACASNADQTTKWSARLLLVSTEDGSVKPFSSNRWSWIGRAMWAADGGGVFLVAWDKEAATMSDQIWFVSYPGDVPRRITNDINGFLGASLSEDSRAILVARTQRMAGVWVGTTANVDGAKKVGVSTDLFTDRYGFAWTPDGRIVFASGAGGQPDIWIMDGDGANRRQLTSERGGNVEPAVSPDGRTVVFVSYRTGERHLWRMNIDGSDPRQLTFGEGDALPTFTPDGAWVIYSSYSSGRPTLWKVPAAGGDTQRLTDFVADSPAVSPDGKLVACFRFGDPTARPKVALVSLADGKVVREFEPPAFVAASEVKWMSDGSAFAYLSAAAGVNNLWLQPVDGSPAKPLTDFNSDHIYRFDISRDGRLVFERGTSVNDAILIKSK